ncbi:MAG: alpha/beta fold hydrolase [Myxococcales bacterium]|nr:alpha/beta fold hydrolase [Myxococcales bacterium]
MTSAAAVMTADFGGEYPWASQFLDVGAGRLAYLDEGPKGAPVLLMLHGNPTWSFYYRHLVKAFSGEYRVVVPDHLGCGRSDKPQGFSYRLEDHIHNVERLVAHLGLEAINLVVHDWGGAIGMGFTVAHPEKVARIVVLNTAAFPSDRIPFTINLVRIPGFGALSVRGLNAFAKVALLRCVHHKERLTEDVKAGYLAPYDSWANRVATLRFVEDIPMSASHPSHAALARIADGLAGLKKKPMLIAWGAHDFVFNRHFYAEWVQRFPDAEAHYIEDASHYVLEDAHERITQWMRPFLTREVAQ